MGVKIEIELDKDSYAPGEEIRGTINVLEGDTARTTSVVIENVEITDDYADVASSHSVGTVHSGDLATGMSLPFTATLPSNAKPNVLGPGTILWRVSAEVDRRGFNAGAIKPFGIDFPPRDESADPPSGSGPISAGGRGEVPGKGRSWAIALAGLAVLGVAAFFALQKITTFDDPVLPQGAALDRELEQRFGDTSWFGHLTAVEGDSPSPGDMSIDTDLSDIESNEGIVRQACDPLLDYAVSYGADDPDIFVHSTADSYVQGQIIMGTDWLCDKSGVRDF